MRGDININTYRRMMAMPNNTECEPIDCQAKAKRLVIDHISKRYKSLPAYEVYVTQFTAIGLSWKAIMFTTLSNTGIYVVQYYALEKKTTMRVYALTESNTVY